MGPTIKQWMEKAIPRIAKEFYIDPELILGKTLKPPYPEARRVIAKELRIFGFSYPQIGKAMNRDHTSIMYMVNDKFRLEKIRTNKERYCAKI